MPRYLNNYWRQIGPVLGGCVPNWLSAAERNGWQKVAACEQTSEGQRVYKVNVWFSQPQSRKESVSLNNNKRLALITSEKCIFPHSSLQCLAEWLFLCAGCFFSFLFTLSPDATCAASLLLFKECLPWRKGALILQVANTNPRLLGHLFLK